LIVQGGAGITGNLNIGTALNYTPANAPVLVGYNINNYSQFAIQNASAGNNASTDIAAVANNGSDNDTYVDVGITSSTYSQSAYSLYGANDGYLIVSGNTTTKGGNLILNTYQANDIIFATGGTFANAEVARFRGNTTTNGNLTIKLTTPNALSANTGALQVWGGASITGNAYHGGGAIFNGGQTAGYDTTIKGKNDNTLLWAHAGTYDSVVIGNSATTGTIVSGAKLQINSSDSILLPVGTNSQRPTASGLGTDTQGMLRYNSTAGGIEWYTGSQWVAATTSFTIIQENQYSGDGSTTAFTLPVNTTTAGVLVSINGIVQIGGAGYAYTVSGTTLTFSQAPASGDVIDTRVITTTSTVQSLSSSTGFTNINVANDNNGIIFQTGTGSAGNVFIMPPGGGLVTGDANVSVSSANTLTTLDSFTAYRSAKYIIQATNGSNYQTMEALVVTTGSAAQVVVYGTVATGGNLGVAAVSASGGTTTLQFIAANSSTNVRLWRQYLPI